MNGVPPVLALALACLALTGCETTQEKSAKLERAALARQRNAPPGAAGLKITRASSTVKVASTAVLHSSEGTAVVVVLRNISRTAEHQVPLEITVHGAGGAIAYANTSPGLSPSLASAAFIPAHGEAVWVDDQVQASSTPASVTAEAGDGKLLNGAAPRVVVGAGHLAEEPGGAAVVQGTVSNRSAIAQKELVVYAIASSGTRVTGAGRAVLSSLGAGASSSFQIFLVGSAPHGARLRLEAPPTTFG